MMIAWGAALMLKLTVWTSTLLLLLNTAVRAERIPFFAPRGAIESASRPERKIAVGDPRPILILFEGSDMAGKSSTIRRVQRALAGVRKIDQAHWLAPSDAEKQQDFLVRYFGRLPGPGTVMFWDRSWYGDAVHPRAQGAISRHEMRRRLGVINRVEGELASKMKIVKIYLDASGERVKLTLDKRTGRTADRLAGDRAAYQKHPEIRRLYRRAVAATDDAIPWKVVDMSDRRAGRENVIDFIERELNPQLSNRAPTKPPALRLRVNLRWPVQKIAAVWQSTRRFVRSLFGSSGEREPL